MNVSPVFRCLACALAAIVLLGLRCAAAAPTRLDLVFSPNQSATDLSGYVRGAPEPFPLDLGGVSGDGVVSPDGKQVAFLELVGDDIDLSVTHLDGTGRKHLVALPGILGPSWSPDGRTLVYAAVNPTTRKTTISTVRVDGTHREQVKMPEIEGLVAGMAFHRPHLSRDGKSVLVTAIVKRNGKATPLILSVDRATGAYRELAEGLDGTWSPDGKRLAFVRVPDQGLATVCIAGPDGSNPRALGLTRSFTPVWSPDGSTLYFNVLSDVDVLVWSARADGTGAAPVKGIPAGAVLRLSSKTLMLKLMDARK